MTRLSVLVVTFCCLAAVSSVHQYPQGASYVYRSDHVGPASYVNVGPKDGAVYYHQPQVFTAPIPVVAAPSYAKVEPILVEAVHGEEASEDYDSEEQEGDADDDYDSDSDEDSDEEDEDSDVGVDEDDTQENGGGNAYRGAHYSAQGKAGSKGYKSHHSFQKGESVDRGDDNDKDFYNKASGHEDKHYDEGDDYGNNHESSKGHKGDDFGHKKSHSKGDETTGFHKVYSKDEFKKDHVFYDNADDSGHFNKHGSDDSNHQSAAGGHKKGGHHDSGHKEGGFGKAGHYKHGGHHDADKGYSGKGGDESYYNRHEDYAKKGGHSDNREFGYGEGH